MRSAGQTRTHQLLRTGVCASAGGQAVEDRASGVEKGERSRDERGRYEQTIGLGSELEVRDEFCVKTLNGRHWQPKEKSAGKQAAASYESCQRPRACCLCAGVQEFHKQ